MKPLTLILLALLAVVLIGTSAFSQSDATYTRIAYMNANNVRTVFENNGVIAQPASAGKRAAWKDDNNGYIGDVSPVVGAEVKYQDSSFHAMVFSNPDRPQANPLPVDPNTGKRWSFQPEPGYFAPAPNQSVAISNNPSSWPAQWPDKLSDPTDPGWSGSWNGYFGKKVSADLETYFKMDDNNYERFSNVNNNARHILFKPDSTNLSRNGLGFEMSVRAMQWAQFLAADNIFWLYEITNTGTTSYDRTVFGLLVGTYVGVTSTEDAGEYNNDWSFYDVTANLTYSGNYPPGARILDPRWNQKFKVGLVGYAFLESPGNPYDGIDNDGDAANRPLGIASPLFQQTSFVDSSVIQPGQTLVMINDDYSRTLFTVPNRDSVRVKTHGMKDSIWIYPGRTRRVPEGNMLTDVQGNQKVNPNALDGIDNNFNGVIDENFSLHYRQYKATRSGTILLNVLRPLHYINYATGAGASPYSMIDERRDDLVDNDQDWSRNTQTGQPVFAADGTLRDDLGRDGLAHTHDFGEGDGLPTSGYNANGFDTGLPGEPHVDKTDVKESDQIGLSSFNYFSPANNYSLGDDETDWTKMGPGYFDVPTSIVNNQPIGGEDGDFTLSSGYFPLLAKKTERFSLALVFGGGTGATTIGPDLLDLERNKATVQKIYDANYQFPTPPDKPTLSAVPGDREVTLYWDRRAEDFVDPVLNTKTFEGYKIYRSTDPNFSDIFTITDGNGVAKGYVPLAQFDLVDSITGFFPATGDLYQASNGYSIWLGTDSGLQHSYVDKNVDNGRKYYYAVVSYSKGSDTAKIFPAENTKQITVLPSGAETHDINVAIVVPNAKVSGYVLPASGVSLTQTAGTATGTIQYNVIDQTKTTGQTYTVNFLDTSIDSVDVNGNVVRYVADSTKWDRRTTYYSVRSNTPVSEQFSINDTLIYILKVKHLYMPSVVIKNLQGTVIPASAYKIDPDLGSVKVQTPAQMPAGTYVITYMYYPVSKSPYIQGTPFLVENKESDIFDGVTLVFNNNWNVRSVDSLARWSHGNPYRFNLSPLSKVFGLNGDTIYSYPKPSDYVLQCSNTIVDTSMNDDDLGLPPMPTYFRIMDITDSSYIKFAYAPGISANGNGKISPLTQIVFWERNPRGGLSRTWNLSFQAKTGDPADTLYPLTTGDNLTLRTSKPFHYGDSYTLTTVLPKYDQSQAKNQLENIKVVPNPYITASSFEAPLPPGITSGRGTRKIDFIHLPPSCSIKIFTSRGDHVITLYHDTGIEDGAVSWNLKTKENLDIAFGVYFYVVESPAGTKTGKIAIIK